MSSGSFLQDFDNEFRTTVFILKDWLEEIFFGMRSVNWTKSSI